MTIFLRNHPKQYHLNYFEDRVNTPFLFNQTTYARRHFRQLIDEPNSIYKTAHLILGIIDCLPIIGAIAGKIEALAFKFFTPIERRIPMLDGRIDPIFGLHASMLLKEIVNKKSLQDLTTFVNAYGIHYNQYLFLDQDMRPGSVFEYICKAKWQEGLMFVIANPENLRGQDSGGQTALHYAAMHHWEEGVSLLLRAGADLNKVNNAGQAPYDIACLSGNPTLVRALLEPAHYNPVKLVKVCTTLQAFYSVRNGLRSLIVSAPGLEGDLLFFNVDRVEPREILNRIEILSMLLEKGASLPVNILDPFHQQTFKNFYGLSWPVFLNRYKPIEDPVILPEASEPEPILPTSDIPGLLRISANPEVASFIGACLSPGELGLIAQTTPLVGSCIHNYTLGKRSDHAAIFEILQKDSYLIAEAYLKEESLEPVLKIAACMTLIKANKVPSDFNDTATLNLANEILRLIKIRRTGALDDLFMEFVVGIRHTRIHPDSTILQNDAALEILAHYNPYCLIKEAEDLAREGNPALAQKLLTALANDGGLASTELVLQRCQDPEILKIILRQDGLLLDNLSVALRNDREIVNTATDQNPAALEFASTDLKRDPELVYSIVSRAGWALKYAHDSLKSNAEIVFAAITNEPWALEFASDALKNNKALVLAAVSRNGFVLKFASTALRNDPEVVEAAVRQTGLALEFASPDLQNSKAIVHLATQQDRRALIYASNALKRDAELLALGGYLPMGVTPIEG